MWGGRFSESPADSLWRFTVDQSDRRLLADDIAGSLAHVRMLGVTDILDQSDADSIIGGLEEIQASAASGDFDFVETDEDVHSAVERRLVELVGDVGGKLHTGRSRNDQVALDMRLYLRRAADQRVSDLRSFVTVLLGLAESVGDAVVAAYTHLQQAQPIRLGENFLAHGWLALRDMERFSEVRSRLNVSPLGAGAVAGSSLPLRPELVAEELGFAGHFENTVDAVGARDAISEYAFCCAQAMTNLSRLAEEVVLWSSTEFGWLTLSDSFATGSSALPQKKNPDIAELLRGRAASVAGDVATLLGIQKGLTLSYSRDLQEDKRAVFHADDSLALALPALGGLLETAEFHPPEPGSQSVALDVAEALVGKGVPFREAHEAVGRLVATLGKTGLNEATPEQLAAAHPMLEAADIPTTAEAVSRRDHLAAQVEKLRAEIEQL